MTNIDHTEYENPAVALLSGAVEDSSLAVHHWPAMSPEFRDRSFTVIEAQAVEVKPVQQFAKTFFAIAWALVLILIFAWAGIQLLKNGDSIGYAGVFSALVIGGMIVWMARNP